MRRKTREGRARISLLSLSVSPNRNGLPSFTSPDCRSLDLEPSSPQRLMQHTAILSKHLLRYRLALSLSFCACLSLSPPSVLPRTPPLLPVSASHVRFRRSSTASGIALIPREAASCLEKRRLRETARRPLSPRHRQAPPGPTEEKCRTGNRERTYSHTNEECQHRSTYRSF